MPATCEQHGLATGPEGTCVLCRRALSAAPKEATGWRRVLLALGAVAALVAFAALRLPALLSGAEARGDEVVEGGEADSAELTEAPVEAGAIDANFPAVEPPPQDFPEDLESRLARAERLAQAEGSEAPEAPELVAADSPAPSEPEPVDPRVLIARLDIRMYAAEWCPHCERARKILQRSGISYREYDIDQDESAKLRNKRLNARGSVPTFDVEGEVMVGFSPEKFARLLERAVHRSSGQRIEISFQE